MAAILHGPQPSGQLGFCVLCAASYKQGCLAEIGDEALKAAKADDDALPINMRKTGYHKLHGIPVNAVAYALVTLPVPSQPGQLMACPAPLCWTHLQAINVIDSAVTLAPAGALPGLPGGAVDLGTRRHG